MSTFPSYKRLKLEYSPWYPLVGKLLESFSANGPVAAQFYGDFSINGTSLYQWQTASTNAIAKQILVMLGMRFKSDYVVGTWDLTSATLGLDFWGDNRGYIYFKAVSYLYRAMNENHELIQYMKQNIVEQVTTNTGTTGTIVDAQGTVASATTLADAPRTVGITDLSDYISQKTELDDTNTAYSDTTVTDDRTMTVTGNQVAARVNLFEALAKFNMENVVEKFLDYFKPLFMGISVEEDEYEEVAWPAS